MKEKRDVVGEFDDRVRRVAAWRRAAKRGLANRDNQVRCARETGMSLAQVRDAVAAIETRARAESKVSRTEP